MPAPSPFAEPLAILSDSLAFTQSQRLFTLSFTPGSGIEEGTLLPQ